MIYANPVPIAQSVSLGVSLVRDTLDCLFNAITDIVSNADRDLTLRLGFCDIFIRNRNLRVNFAEDLLSEVTSPKFEKTMRRSNSPVSDHWKRRSASFSNLDIIKRPD